MYLYLSLAEVKVAEFYHNMDGKRYLVWLNKLIFVKIWRQLMKSLLTTDLKIDTLKTILAAYTVNNLKWIIMCSDTKDLFMDEYEQL